MARFDLRSEKTIREYEDYQKSGGLDRGCRLCQKDTVEEFEHWRILENSFPYDRIATKHMLLVTKIHAVEGDLPKEVMEEFFKIKTNHLAHTYTFVMEAMPHARSIPEHHHYHLIVIKTEE